MIIMITHIIITMRMKRVIDKLIRSSVLAAPWKGEELGTGGRCFFLAFTVSALVWILVWVSLVNKWWNKWKCADRKHLVSERTTAHYKGIFFVVSWCHLINMRMILSQYGCSLVLKGNSGIFKPYFWHEIRSSTHREQFGESRRPSEDI